MTPQVETCEHGVERLVPACTQCAAPSPALTREALAAEVAAEFERYAKLDADLPGHYSAQYAAGWESARLLALAALSKTPPPTEEERA